MKSKKYSIIVNGQLFEDCVTFSAKNDSNFFNNIEHQIKEKYCKQDQIIKIDHASMVIKLNFE